MTDTNDSPKRRWSRGQLMGGTVAVIAVVGYLVVLVTIYIVKNRPSPVSPDQQRDQQRLHDLLQKIPDPPPLEQQLATEVFAPNDPRWSEVIRRHGHHCAVERSYVANGTTTAGVIVRVDCSDGRTFDVQVLPGGATRVTEVSR